MWWLLRSGRPRADYILMGEKFTKVNAHGQLNKMNVAAWPANSAYSRGPYELESATGNYKSGAFSPLSVFARFHCVDLTWKWTSRSSVSPGCCWYEFRVRNWLLVQHRPAISHWPVFFRTRTKKGLCGLCEGSLHPCSGKAATCSMIRCMAGFFGRC